MPDKEKRDPFGELDSAFIDRYLRREGETLEEAKARIMKEQKEKRCESTSEEGRKRNG